jgi:hypothetical protein
LKKNRQSRLDISNCKLGLLVIGQIFIMSVKYKVFLVQ